MANELTLTSTFSFTKNSSTFALSASGLQVDVSGTNAIHNRQIIGTSAEALVLGDVAAGGYFIGINRDGTNFIEIRHATGGTDLVKMLAGEVAMFRISGDATAPAAIADTANCELEYIILDA